MFLDALASLDLKLWVSESVSDSPFPVLRLAHLRVFQSYCLLEFTLYLRSRPCFSLYLYLCPYVYLYLCAAATWQTSHSCRVHTPPLLLAELKTAGSVCRSTSPPGNTQVFYFIFIILRILLHKTWLCNFFRNIHGRWFMFICVSFCAQLRWLIDETFYIKFCLKGSQS